MKKKADVYQEPGDDALLPYLIRIRSTKKNYFTTIANLGEIVIYPDVMSPAFEWSHELMADMMSVQELVDKRVLDVGCGSGILGLFASKYGAAEVIGVDINPNAIDNTNENFRIFDVKGKALMSNLFEGLQNQKFDVIVFNAPYHAFPPNITNDFIEYGVADQDYSVLKKFVSNCAKFLARDGRVILGFSTSGDIEMLKNEFKKNDFTVHRTLSADKFGYNATIFELRLSS